MMKRLTIRNSDGSVSQPTDLNWAAALEKLAAYEDTGLDPEEIEKANNVMVSAFNLAVNSGTDMLVGRLKEIIRAEAEGRLLVLPCRVGDVVYITGSKYRAGRDETWVNTGKFRFSDLEKLGKTVFLSREEAEAALEKESAV